MKSHTVHTKHPRYKVPNYPRGQGSGQVVISGNRMRRYTESDFTVQRRVNDYGHPFRRWALKNDEVEINMSRGFFFPSRKEPNRAYIRDLIISEEHRNKGRGTAIYRDMEEILRADGVTKVILKAENDDARRFWMRQGYKLGFDERGMGRSMGGYNLHKMI